MIAIKKINLHNIRFLFILSGLWLFTSCRTAKIITEQTQKQETPAQKKQFLHTFTIIADEKSEAKLGNFPWRRSLLAEAVKRLSQSKAIVIMFHLDEKRSIRDDSLLELNVGKQKNVVLMARLTGEKTKIKSNPFYERNLFLKTYRLRYQGKYAVFPYSSLADRAAHIGFCSIFSDQKNTSPDRFPLTVSFQGNAYPTLPLAALQIAARIPRKEIFTRNGYLFMNHKQVPASYSNDMPNLFTDQEPVLHSFVDLIEGRLSSELWQNKVVVIGFHFNRTPLWPVNKGHSIKRVHLTVSRIETLLQWYYQ